MLKLIGRIRRMFDLNRREHQIKRVIELSKLSNHAIFDIEEMFYKSTADCSEKERLAKEILLKYHKEYRLISNPNNELK